MIRKPQTSNVPFDEEQVMNVIFPEKHTNGLVEPCEWRSIDCTCTGTGMSCKDTIDLSKCEELDLDKFCKKEKENGTDMR